jgi:hypothetical protein
MGEILLGTQHIKLLVHGVAVHTRAVRKVRGQVPIFLKKTTCFSKIIVIPVFLNLNAMLDIKKLYQILIS